MSQNSRISFRAATRRGLTFATVTFTVLCLSACASIQTTQITGSKDTMSIHEVSITRTAVIPGTPEQVFTFITAEDVLPKVLTGYGPLPAVVRTSGNTGPWDTPGSARVNHFSDGGTVREQVTHYDYAKYFAYRVWDFTNPVVKALASQGRGEWTFHPDPGGTRVEWTYTFTAKGAASAIPLSGITQILWRGYMDVCLENSKRMMAAAVKSI